jgi:hypothetical protein
MPTTVYSETASSGQQPLAPTDIRLQLLANGYTPLPTLEKRCFMKGWPTAVVDEVAIADWTRRHSRWQDTGIRVQDGLGVFDLDINHEVMHVIVDALEKEEPAVSETLLRHGTGFKEAWFFRVDEPFTRIFTRRWLAPGTVEDDGAHGVEVFGGASHRFFGSFGANKREPDGSVAVAYSWEGASPLEVPLADLPVITKAQVFKLIDLVERVLEQEGWTPVQRSKKGESEAERVYDLTDDMLFDCSDDRTRTLAELQAVAGEEGLKCSASWLEGPSAIRRDRCLVARTHSGAVSVWESASGETHLPASAKPTTEVADQREMMNRVAEKLQELKDRRRLKLTSADSAYQAANKLLETYAYCANQQLVVVPIWATSITDGMTLTAFRNKYAQYVEDSEPGPKGGVKKIHAADLWLTSDRRVTVEGLRMRPDMPRPTFEEEGKLYVNIYNPEVHDGGEEGDAEIGIELLEQILPDEVERRWFIQWLAYKYRNPSVPGPAVVMVAREHGTGRGTLGELLKLLFGARYVRSIGFDHFAGRTYQSQYTEWMADSLIVLVNESSTADNGSAYRTKHDTYERLKEIVDPRAQTRTIIGKGIKAYDALVCASCAIFTNNPDALPLPASDRRFWVGTNGEVQDVRYWDAVNAWMAQQANVAAFAAWLLDVDLTGYSPYAMPPMTVGKAAMTELASSPIDHAFEEAVRFLPGEVLIPEQIITAMREYKEVHNAEYPDRWEPIARRLAQRKLFRVGVKDGANWTIKYETKKYPLYARTQRLATIWTGADGTDLRREALSSGLPTASRTVGDMLSGLKIVANKEQ